MKKIIMMAALALPCLFAGAQDKPIRLGIKAGANFSTFNNDVYPFNDSSDPKFMYFKRGGRSAGMFGLTADFNVKQRCTLGAEVLFTAKGMTYYEENNYVYEVDEDGYEKQAYNHFNYNINYLEVPVTANYNFYPGSGNVLLRAYIGLAPSIAIHGKTKLRYAKGTDGDGRRANNETNTLRDVRYSNNSALAGFQVAGLGRDFKKVSPYLDLRASYLLRPVFSGTSQAGSSLNTRMYTFTFAVGVKF